MHLIIEQASRYPRVPLNGNSYFVQNATFSQTRSHIPKNLFLITVYIAAKFYMVQDGEYAAPMVETATGQISVSDFVSMVHP